MNFFTFKWGDKYGSEYVNRLYGSLKAHYQKPFTLTCYTDNTTGIREEVQTTNIELLRRYDTDRVFTYEKLVLMDYHEKGIWLDLDILIHQDITSVVNNIKEDDDFIMIWNHWNDYEKRSLRWYGRGVACHVNSSFVYFNNPQWLKSFTAKNWDKIEWTYKSLDKYMFYQHHRNNNLSYWPRKIFSNYNVQGFQLANKITVFNTSHIQANNLNVKAYELHEANQDVVDLWRSYD